MAVAFPFCRGRVAEVGNDGTPQKIPVGHRCFPRAQFRPVGNTRLPQRPPGPCLCFPLLRMLFRRQTLSRRWAVFGCRAVFWWGGRFLGRRTVFGWLTIFRWRTVSRRWAVFGWGGRSFGGTISRRRTVFRRRAGRNRARMCVNLAKNDYLEPGNQSSFRAA